MNTKKKAIVVLSGGQDSTTCAFVAKQQGFETHGVTFNYGQRHQRELDAARIVGQRAGLASHEFINLGSHVLRGTSPLVSDEPLEEYKDHHSLPGGVEKTFVPMRNQMFLTIAANRAYVLGANVLYTGVCQEDFGGYPDCRQSFIDLFAETSVEGTFTGANGGPFGLTVFTPLMDLTKGQSVELALSMEGCYEALAFTHTSYDGAYPPTGHDHATLLRAKGFEEVNVPDPLILRAWAEGKMALPDAANYKKNHIRPFLKRLGYV
jgi:queuosine biosynthesis protein QueC